jgi:hypothetical protein
MKKVRPKKVAVKKAIAKKRGEKEQRRKEVRKRHLAERRRLIADLKRRRQREFEDYYQSLMGMQGM